MTTQSSKNVGTVAESIQWFGQSSVKMQHLGKTIYIDPFNLKVSDKADVIFITHPHFDHFSVEDIKKIATNETVVFCPVELKEKIMILGISKIHPVTPGFKSEWEGISVQAVPAYNVIKSDKHPRRSNWVGYVLTINGVRIYHTGDTERIPEMQHIPCDIILLPLGQTYTMNTVDDAVKAVLDTKASIAIPIHFGMYEGKVEDAENFAKMLEGNIRVIIPKQSAN
ncbi:MAG: MBL fold metallo-hydrolase [Bacteroidales bacterium]|nr:MBL fold metallo-hydrolase [Bacteroidales bacterium]